MSIPFMLLWTVFVADPSPTDPSNPQNLISLVITTGLSATVAAALITGLVQYFITRRTSRIAERKNAVDAETDLINRYKDQATEERTQKESAVQTIQTLLDNSKEQIESLKTTISVLNQTIENLNTVAQAQNGVIDDQKNAIDTLTKERDRQAEALKKAEAELEEQRSELAKRLTAIEALRAQADKLSTGPINTTAQ